MKPLTCPRCGRRAEEIGGDCRACSYHPPHLTDAELIEARRERIARLNALLPNQTGPTRSGVCVIFFLLWCLSILTSTAIGCIPANPRDIASVQTHWHGPAHRYPQEYQRNGTYAGRL